MAAGGDPRSIRVSSVIYRSLIWAYPRRFREDYREEMTLLFRDSCRDAHRQRGVRGLGSVWVRALLDLGRNLPQERAVDLVSTDPPLSPTLLHCTYCSEEITAETPRCIYCGADLSLPLATATVPRSPEHQGRFGDDIPGSFISGTPIM